MVGMLECLRLRFSSFRQPGQCHIAGLWLPSVCLCIFLLHAEEVACGMHHVAVVASKVQANGDMLKEARRSRLLTWGKGGQGQLGVDAYKDYNLPQVWRGSMLPLMRSIVHSMCSQPGSPQ